MTASPWTIGKSVSHEDITLSDLEADEALRPRLPQCDAEARREHAAIDVVEEMRGRTRTKGARVARALVGFQGAWTIMHDNATMNTTGTRASAIAPTTVFGCSVPNPRAYAAKRTELRKSALPIDSAYS